MAYVVTIRDVVPPARDDTLPWVTAELQESATAAEGSWADIDSFPLSPQDSDPSNPAARSFTTENATLERGFYRLRFLDQTADNSSWTDPMENAALPLWAPAVREIASIMRARTKDADSNEIGTFNQLTRPNAEQVEEEISNQAGFVALLVGFAPADPNVRTAAKNLTKLRTAMALESSYYPEQIESGQSAYRAWQDQYKIDYAALKKIIDPDDSGGTTDPDAGMPSYKFPSVRNLVGWRTRL